MIVKENIIGYYSVVGENIKKYRSLRNLSLQMLAEMVGVTKKDDPKLRNRSYPY